MMTKRPTFKVSACLATSLDGKLCLPPHAPQRQRLGSDDDLARLVSLRSGVDALLVGGETFRQWPVVRRRAAAPATEAPPRLVIVSHRWALAWDSTFWRQWQADWPPVWVASPVAPPDGTPYADCWQWLPLPTAEEPAMWLAPLREALEAVGCAHLQVEGGGTVMDWVVRADWLETLYLTVTPWLIGGATTPTLMDGHGLDSLDTRWVLRHTKQSSAGELFLTYTRP